MWPNKNTLCCYSNAFFLSFPFQGDISYCRTPYPSFHQLLFKWSTHLHTSIYKSYENTLFKFFSIPPFVFRLRISTITALIVQTFLQLKNFTIFNANFFWQLSTVKPYLHEHLRQMFYYTILMVSITKF